MQPFGKKQSGLALVLLVFTVALFLIYMVLRQYDAATLKDAQLATTERALATAKEAILAHSAESILYKTTCKYDCDRPGDIVCPDKNNNGIAASGCKGSILGRVPWKTLGIGDIRDGANTRLWYALSESYQSMNRILPLNSNTNGMINLRNAQGALTYNVTDNTGVVAVIIAPGQPLTRQDNLVQNRNASNVSLPEHFLDIAYGEDNADFVKGTANGFVSGIVRNGSQTIANDIILPITKSDINRVMKKRVLIEVKAAILKSAIYPTPADPDDNTCETSDEISKNACKPAGVDVGFIPVGDGTVDIWANQDANSILRGASLHNWFQQNGWRGLIRYNRNACMNGADDCVSFY